MGGNSQVAAYEKRWFHLLTNGEMKGVLHRFYVKLFLGMKNDGFAEQTIWQVLVVMKLNMARQLGTTTTITIKTQRTVIVI